MPMRTPRLGASLRWPLLLLLLLGLADALRYSRAPRVINVRVRRAYRNIEAEVAALRDIGAPSKALVRLRDSSQHHDARCGRALGRGSAGLAS